MGTLTAMATNGLFGAGDDAQTLVCPLDIVIGDDADGIGIKQHSLERLKTYQKEANTLRFSIYDNNGAEIDVTSTTMTLYGKRRLDDSTTYIFEKVDVDFDKNVGGNDYIVEVSLSATDTDFEGEIFSLLKIDFGASDIKKGAFRINNAVSPE